MSNAPPRDPAANRPVDEILHGRLKSSIWRNETERGARYDATFSKVYKDREGRWQEKRTFGSDDLLGLGHLSTKTFDRVGEMKREEKERRMQSEQNFKAKRQRNSSQKHSQNRER